MVMLLIERHYLVHMLLIPTWSLSAQDYLKARLDNQESKVRILGRWLFVKHCFSSQTNQLGQFDL
jgi:hypothetical protein